MKLGRERPSRSLVDNPTSWTKPPIGSPVLKYGVTPKFGRVYGDIHLGTGLIAGNSLEPYSPKRNRSKDWTISSEAFIDLEERSPMLSSVPNALRGWGYSAVWKWDKHNENPGKQVDGWLNSEANKGDMWLDPTERWYTNPFKTIQHGRGQLRAEGVWPKYKACRLCWIIWAEDCMRLDANFIPHTHYRVSGWLEERWVISPCDGKYTYEAQTFMPIRDCGVETARGTRGQWPFALWERPHKR